MTFILNNNNNDDGDDDDDNCTLSQNTDSPTRFMANVTHGLSAMELLKLPLKLLI